MLWKYARNLLLCALALAVLFVCAPCTQARAAEATWGIWVGGLELQVAGNNEPHYFIYDDTAHTVTSGTSQNYNICIRWPGHGTHFFTLKDLTVTHTGAFHTTDLEELTYSCFYIWSGIAIITLEGSNSLTVTSVPNTSADSCAALCF